MLYGKVGIPVVSKFDPNTTCDSIQKNCRRFDLNQYGGSLIKLNLKPQFEVSTKINTLQVKLYVYIENNTICLNFV